VDDTPAPEQQPRAIRAQHSAPLYLEVQPSLRNELFDHLAVVAVRIGVAGETVGTGVSDVVDWAVTLPGGVAALEDDDDLQALALDPGLKLASSRS